MALQGADPPDATASLFAAIRANVRECRRVRRLERALSEGASVDSVAALEADEEEDGFLTGAVPALVLAVRLGRNRIAKLLLERGADVHACAGAAGVTALHVSAVRGNVEMTVALAAAGGDVNAAAAAAAADLYGLTPMLIGEIDRKGCAIVLP